MYDTIRDSQLLVNCVIYYDSQFLQFILCSPTIFQLVAVYTSRPGRIHCAFDIAIIMNALTIVTALVYIYMYEFCMIDDKV